MLKNSISICFVLISCLSWGQENSKEYIDLIEKGRTLDQKEDYINAAITFSKAVNLPGNIVPLIDWHRAAYTQALAKNPDSAFYYLDIITKINDLTFKDVLDVITDEDFTPIHSDNRWQIIKDKLFSNGYKTFLLSQNKAGGKITTPRLTDLAFARALGNNDDTAFTHLNDAACLFLKKKMVDKAYQLFKLSLETFPENYTINRNMGDYYFAIGEKGLGYIYYSRAEIIKYKQPSNISTHLNIDSAIKTVYVELSQKTGYKVLPPEYLVSIIANTMLKKGMRDKAFGLLKMNVDNYPNSFTANREVGDFYSKRGDQGKANEYYAKSLKLEYSLPDNFFTSSFRARDYIKTYYQKIANLSGAKVLPPESVINSFGNIFLVNNYFDNAEALFKMNIENYPNSWNAFSSMSDFYEATGNTEKAKEFRNQSFANKSITRTETIPPAAPVADTTYNIRVATPVCRVNCPTILIDEAHNNYMKGSGLYKPFANLMANDGFKIIQGRASFTKELLAQTNVIVIATTGEIKHSETQILTDWIKHGGSLLAITDHENFEIDELLESLGVQALKLNATIDSLHMLPVPDGSSLTPYYIYFSDKDNLFGNHPIIRGRNDSEKIKVIKTFAGRSIIGPPGSSVLLLLNKSAVDFMAIDPAQRINSRVAVKTKEGLRSFGIAFTFGKGRVVVISEAATLTAQLFRSQWKIGMNTPGSDNKQFALNIMRWLTGYLK